VLVAQCWTLFVVIALEIMTAGNVTALGRKDYTPTGALLERGKLAQCQVKSNEGKTNNQANRIKTKEYVRMWLDATRTIKNKQW
jgi:hypothetical protein